MDLTGLNLASLEANLLLGSVLGVPRVLVEAERLREGIMDVLSALTLAERARDALVGVETALGRPTGCVFIGKAVFSFLLSREIGRVLEASSSWLRLTRFSGDAQGSFVGPKVLKDLERGRLDGMPDPRLSKPVLELFRFSEYDVVGAVTLLWIFVFQVET